MNSYFSKRFVATFISNRFRNTERGIALLLEYDLIKEGKI